MNPDQDPQKAHKFMIRTNQRDLLGSYDIEATEDSHANRFIGYAIIYKKNGEPLGGIAVSEHGIEYNFIDAELHGHVGAPKSYTSQKIYELMPKMTKIMAIFQNDPGEAEWKLNELLGTAERNKKTTPAPQKHTKLAPKKESIDLQGAVELGDEKFMHYEYHGRAEGEDKLFVGTLVYSDIKTKEKFREVKFGPRGIEIRDIKSDKKVIVPYTSEEDGNRPGDSVAFFASKNFKESYTADLAQHLVPDARTIHEVAQHINYYLCGLVENGDAKRVNRFAIERMAPGLN